MAQALKIGLSRGEILRAAPATIDCRIAGKLEAMDALALKNLKPRSEMAGAFLFPALLQHRAQVQSGIVTGRSD